MNESGPIVFYDGECGLCHGFVRFVIERDPRKRFRFAPIKGDTWKRVVDVGREADATTLYLLDDDDLLVRSSAICRLLKGIGGGWWIVGGLLWTIPRPIRNLGYRLVAKTRYLISGRVDACTLPAPDDMDRLLP